MFFRKYSYYFTSIFTLLFQMKPWARVLGIFLGFKKPEEKPVVELRPNGLRFRTRTAMDIWSLKETMLDHFYEKFGFEIQDGWTVIDIGGGIGDFTILASYQHPKNKVFAFEPTPSSYALLQENLQTNRISNVQLSPAAVWSANGEIVIDTGIGEPVQFTSKALENGEKPVSSKVVVPGLSLESVFQQISIVKCDLMKLDCEGAEYEILFKAPDSVLNRIDRIVMEYHDNAVEYTHADMERFLKEKGYKVKVYPSPVHPYLGYLSAAR